MVVEFVCVRCGAKFTRERSRRGGNPPQVCEACKAARAHDYHVAARRRRNAEEKMKRAAARPVKPAKIVKRCRRCGRTFEEKRLSLTKVANASEGYVEHRYCPNCRRKQRRAAQACDISFVQLSLLGYAACVQHMDALSQRRISPDRYTPGWYLHHMPMRGVKAA